jgi:hypothetical protein
VAGDPLSAPVDRGLYQESAPALASQQRPAGKTPESGIKPRCISHAANPILPIATLAAEVFLMIAPRIISFFVAVYLIFVGLFGLNGIYHIIK